MALGVEYYLTDDQKTQWDIWSSKIYGYFGGALSKREHFGSIVMFSFE